MKTSRVKNTLKNSLVGMGTLVLGGILSFCSRTVFIKVLGVDYLGVNGLFASVLGMLALSDLGMYTVMTYSLYEPLAIDDKPKIAVLVHFFQRLYNYIACIVFVIGLSLIPLLPKMIEGVPFPFSELVVYYIILLCNSSVSYFAISRATLFRADQKIYILKIITSIFSVLMYITQIILLVWMRSFTAYLICQVIYTLGTNVALSIWASRKYPFLREHRKQSVPSGVYRQIVDNIKSSFLYKLGAHIMNSTDNILISVLVGTAMVGYFSNYVTIYSMVSVVVMMCIDAVLASIGNFVATETNEKKYQLFKVLMFLMYAVAAFCASCYLAGMNDFIRIWLGEEFVLGGGFVCALVFNRFVFCAIHPLWMLRESAGIFASMRYVMIIAAGLNIGLSVWFGRWIGVSGIILATSFAYLLTVYWYEPLQLSKYVFQNSLADYWKYVFKLLQMCVFPLVFGFLLMGWKTTHIVILLSKFFGCGIVIMVSVMLFFRHSAEYMFLKDKFKKLVK